MATSHLGLTKPNNLNAQKVDTGLLQKRWNDNQLYMESLQGDPIIGNPDLVKVIEVGSGKNKVPFADSLILDITPKDKKGKGARNVELVFLKSLTMAPIEGNGSSLIGNEATLQLKYTNNYANDWAAGVVEDVYGIDFREIANYGIYSEIRPLLAQWLNEVRGMYARQAYITRISQNLTTAPISMTASLNPNWYFPALSAASQPAYDATLNNLEQNIGVAATTIGASALLNVPELLTLIDYAREVKYIEPMTIAGKPMYVLFACTDQVRRLRDPSVANSWGAYYNVVTATEDVKKVVPNAEITIGDELLVVRDPRYATMTKSGTASDWNLSFGYLKYGRTSTRTSLRNTSNFDVNIFAGRGSLCVYEPEAPHYENQPDEYGKYKGTGLFGAVGYQTPIWDLDAAQQSSATAQQESSMIIPTSRV